MARLGALSCTNQRRASTSPTSYPYVRRRGCQWGLDGLLGPAPQPAQWAVRRHLAPTFPGLFLFSEAVNPPGCTSASAILVCLLSVFGVRHCSGRYQHSVWASREVSEAGGRGVGCRKPLRELGGNTLPAALGGRFCLQRILLQPRDLRTPSARAFPNRCEAGCMHAQPLPARK